MVALHTRAPVPAFVGLAGVAVRDVTPAPGVRARNWGPADWDVSEGAHRAMTLTAVALAEERTSADEAAEPLVLVTVDGTWWRRVDDEATLRTTVLDATGLPVERLLVSLSHTHAGPVLCSGDADLPGGDRGVEYLRDLARAAAEAAAEAVGALRPATLEWATGHCGLASNREALLDGCAAGAPGATEGSSPRPLVGFNPDAGTPRSPGADPADDTVVVGRLTARPAPAAGETPDGVAHPGEPVTLATIVNYACHPTTLAWQNRLVSPDYVGAMRDLVERETGAPVAFLQGASGELAPREQYTGDTAVADRHGTSLGHAVLAALAELPPPGTELELTHVVESGAPLAVWEPAPSAVLPGSGTGARPDARTLAAVEEPVTLDLRDLPTWDELEAEWAGIDPRSREERLRRARNLRDGYVTGPTVPHPTWVWRVGEALLVAHPGEAYSRLQRTVRAHAGARPVVVANLTNGPGFVYLPPREAYDVGAYQAWQSPLAPGSLERLERHACAVVDDVLVGAAAWPPGVAAPPPAAPASPTRIVPEEDQ
ncbi:hypothetical protein CBR64_12600 [Cellulosimicrobium cellulans]|uniref:Neutral/alkaline non-lysosomal ceramidase N-terminal domain-containing protein n=1 Tax=Cellulosimicrobium cellulans TaxID=1710 RepID=A0A1Y0HXZ1_CELCE|nr:hypothetical protein [Cellulosimicrobium cellulans]ARU52175.1 hypothetical protein CBR64_12600 [Cellulosimicrobium cellulans]